jgi:hypothetical protein
MISNEQLFQEDFKPVWLSRQERLAQDSFIEAVTAKRLSLTISKGQRNFTPGSLPNIRLNTH